MTLRTPMRLAGLVVAAALLLEAPSAWAEGASLSRINVSERA